MHISPYYHGLTRQLHKIPDRTKQQYVNSTRSETVYADGASTSEEYAKDVILRASTDYDTSQDLVSYRKVK